MSQNIEKDISRLDWHNTLSIALNSGDLKVLIVGGGRAAFIKANTFIQSGATVTVLARELSDKFVAFNGSDKFNYVHGEYNSGMISAYHLVVGAVDDEKLLALIKSHCDTLYKLFLNCSDGAEGSFTMSTQGNTEGFRFSVNSIGGNPKLSAFMLEKVKELLFKYDDFAVFAGKIRNQLKADGKNRNELRAILDFICTDEFYGAFQAGIAEEALKSHFEGKTINKNSKK